MSATSITIALLALATGLSLSFCNARSILICLFIFYLALLIPISDLTSPLSIELMSWGAGVSTIIAALAVHWPQGLNKGAGAALAFNGGIWCGVLVAPPDMTVHLGATAFLLIALPGHWFVRSSSAPMMKVLLKIFAGWVVAVAILSTALPYLMTPGNQTDHRE